MVEGLGVSHDPDVAKPVEEDERPKLLLLIRIGLGQLRPECPSGDAVEVAPRRSKDSPDKTRAVVSAVIRSAEAIPNSEPLGNLMVEQGGGFVKEELRGNRKLKAKAGKYQGGPLADPLFRKGRRWKQRSTCADK